MTSQVTRVARFSTGRVDIHPEHAHRGRTPMYWWILASRRWLPARPINIYVIEHTDGLVVFDTGQDGASITDPGYFPGGPVGVLYRRLARFDIPTDETLSAGLTRLRYTTTDVTTAVISHLHQDHIGGIRELSHADLLVSADEWRSLQRPLAEARGLLTDHINLPGLHWTTVDFAPLRAPTLRPFTTGHDLFGDGALVLLPTPGHTPGSMSLVRRPDAAPLLLVRRHDLRHPRVRPRRGRRRRQQTPTPAHARRSASCARPTRHGNPRRARPRRQRPPRRHDLRVNHLRATRLPTATDMMRATPWAHSSSTSPSTALSTTSSPSSPTPPRCRCGTRRSSRSPKPQQVPP